LKFSTVDVVDVEAAGGFVIEIDDLALFLQSFLRVLTFFTPPFVVESSPVRESAENRLEVGVPESSSSWAVGRDETTDSGGFSQ
jgi:hypothetical protein